MQIYDDKKKRIGILAGFANRTITKTLDSGDKEISFEYPVNGELVHLLKEEYYIRTKEDEFVLKEIETGEKYNKYTAVLNVEELEGTHFPYGFASQEQTIRACLEFAFEDTGWTVGICTIAKKRTIDIEEKTTAWDVLQQCLKTYRCECWIDSLNKTVNIYEQIGEDRGCYFMEGLNLRKLTLKSDTYEFYTRIYPIGKDGITIEWMNGKPYLENYQYSKKIKTYVWKDERYTNTTSLIEDAEAKLEEMSKPYKVYTADVADLAKANPVYQNILDYGIGDTVILVSKKTKTREKQRIVKLTEYPETPEKNTVELSNTSKTFAEVQKTETELAKQDAISIAKSSTKKILGDYPTTEEVETKITASKEEIELGVMHTLDGYYDKTQTDAKIGVAVGEIELSVSQTYQTKDEMGNYSTTEETKALIDLTADEIELGVSKKVGSDEIIAKINLSPEKADIQADKINLNGAVTANNNFKILLDGSMEAQNGKFKGKIESKEAKITGGSLEVGVGCEITSIGELYANFPRVKNGIYVGKEKKNVGLKDMLYNLAMFYVGDLFYVGSTETGSTWMGGEKVVAPNIFCTGDLTCTGTKNRIEETKDFGFVKQYCYEMASPFFGDAGNGKIDETGKCYVFLDSKFMQTIETEHEYIIFLTAAGEGELYVRKEETKGEFFVVSGTPGLEFFWEVKAKQKGYENERLEQAEVPEQPDKFAEKDQIMINEMDENVIRVETEIEKDERETIEMELRRMEELEWMGQEQ